MLIKHKRKILINIAFLKNYTLKVFNWQFYFQAYNHRNADKKSGFVMEHTSIFALVLDKSTQILHITLEFVSVRFGEIFVVFCLFFVLSDKQASTDTLKLFLKVSSFPAFT